MSTNTDRKAAVKKLRTLVLTPKADVEEFRTRIEDTFSTIFLPNNVEREERDIGGVRCDMLVPELYSAQRVMLYVHGGSFAGGSRASYRNFCSSLANSCSCRVVVPEFKLPPTHPFPASIDNVMAVFQALYEEAQDSGGGGRDSGGRLSDSGGGVSDSGGAGQNSGSEPRKIILAADGSGASIALAVFLRLEQQQRPCVGNIVLFSPWLDVASDCPQIKGRHVHDEVISGNDMHRAVDLYTYASNFTNPLVSPLRASGEDFEGCPPVYIQLGAGEMLYDQSETFRQKLVGAGVSVIMDIWPDMMYMFQMADEFLPESHLAVEKLGKFINRRDDTEDEATRREREEILRKNNIVRE